LIINQLKSDLFERRNDGICAALFFSGAPFAFGEVFQASAAETTLITRAHLGAALRTQFDLCAPAAL
jgi:hypothetical protein